MNGLYGQEESLVLKMKQKEIEDALSYLHIAEKYGLNVPDFNNNEELLNWYFWSLAHEDL
jgi:hypothetical protein